MHSKRLLILIFAGLLMTAPQSVHGIGAEEALRPALPPAGSLGEVVSRQKKDEGKVDDDQQVIIPQLHGIVLTTRPIGLSVQPTQLRTGLKIEGLSILETRFVAAILQQFLTRPVTLRSLDDMARQVETSLEKQRQTLMRATFPPQEITSGVVTMIVSPARVGRVTVHGSSAFNPAFIKDSLRMTPGDVLRRGQLAADIDWLNENPLRTARAVLSPSAQEDHLDLALLVDARKPWRIFNGLDNSLSDRLGDWRWYLGLQHGNVWNLDHRITAQLTAGLDYEALHGGSLTYELPLPWRHLLEAGLSYSESRSQRTSGGTLVDQSGSYQRYQLAYVIPLTEQRGWHLQSRTGLTLRDQVYNLDASRPGAASVQRRQGWQGFQIESGLTARRQDQLGDTLTNLRLIWNPGGTLGGSSDKDVRQLGAGGSQAWMAELSLQRTLNLKKAGMLRAQLDAQWSDRALLAADQFAPAISGRVRGFDEITGYGDNGATVILEWLTTWRKLARLGAIRGILFADGALVHQRMAARDTELLSTGAGLRWQRKMFSVQCDLGVPLHATQGIETRPRARFSMTCRW